MKKTILIFLALAICISAGAQKKTKDRAIADTLQWESAWNALADSSFVLEADALTFKNGSRVVVNNTVNFISVDGSRGVVQISPSTMYSGPNGVGGFTMNGRVFGVESKTDKRGNLRISMNVMGTGISARIDITLYSGRDDASAVITPNFNSMTVRMEGKIVPLGLSGVVEGRPVY